MSRFESSGLAQRLALVLAAALSAGCSGGGHSTPSTPVVAPATPVPNGATSPGQALAFAKITIDVPFAMSASASRARRPDYVSSATLSFRLVLNAPPAGYVQPAVLTVTPGSGACPVDPLHPKNYACTLTAQLPPGSDSVTLTAFSGAGATGAILSQQTTTLPIVAGAANTPSITLDAAVAGATVSATSQCASGPVASPIVTSGTTPVTVSVASVDPAARSIVGPGLPTISINGSPANGTFALGAGTVAFTIDQGAQTVTLTPSGPSATIATFTLSLDPPTTTDGLSYHSATTLSFFDGPANAPSLLASIENTSTGQIDLNTVTLGGSGAADTFSATTTLARTVSTTETGVFDVDHPAALAFDAAGDLLVANGGGSPAGDVGNFACVPAASFASASALTATVRTLLDGPLGIAYDARDGSAALANAPSNAADSLSEYLLQGPYASAPAARNIPESGKLGATAVANLPGLAAGSYAVALTTGTPKAPHGTGTSEIAVLPAGGAEYTFTDPTIDDPTGLAYDATNGQLVIGSSSPFEPVVDYYTVGAGSAVQVHSTNLGTITPSFVATSPDGHVAVGGPAGAVGDPQVQVFDATALRLPVGPGPIPFNNVASPQSATYLYDVPGGGTAALEGLTWLSNTKLLISLATHAGGVQGLYIADISATSQPLGSDDLTGLPFAPAPKLTGFKATAAEPLGAAYRP